MRRTRKNTFPTDWLQRRLNVEQAEAENLTHKAALGPEPLPFGAMHSAWLALRAQMQPGDALWAFSSPSATWGPHLCGRAGVVLLRGGQVVAQVLTRMS